VANYVVSTNTNNSNKTTQEKTNKRHGKSHQLRLFVFKPEFLKIYVDLKTASAAQIRVTGRQWLEMEMKVSTE
jgi:hypothetical protein